MKSWVRDRSRMDANKLHSVFWLNGLQTFIAIHPRPVSTYLYITVGSVPDSKQGS